MTIYKPAVSGDDGYWGIGGGADPFNSNFGDLSFGTYFTGFADEQAFIRFPNVLLTNAQTVTSAALTLNAAGKPGAGTVRIKIQAEAADNPAAPTSSGDGNGRTHTTAGTDWDITTWTTSVDYTSPDLTAVVQEVVDRAGWALGNALILYLVEDGSDSGAVNNAATQDASTSLCGRLEITVAVPSAGGNRMGGTGAIREARRKRPTRRRRK